ncbi:GNAT family N-acetyltransferase [Bifidobacterium sp. 64T4]|nr:GNAT family N-acetyltransferase [Bifidobacterium pongonis]
MRRADYRAVAELIRQAWYADSDAGNDVASDAAGETVRGESAAMSRRRSTRGLSVSQRLAAIDTEECLSRTTHAAVAEYEGHVAGVILGSIQGRTVPGQRLRHRMRQMRVGLPLLGSKEGVRGLCGQLALTNADGKLLRDAGLGKRAEEVEEVGETKEANRAEIVLFIVSPEMRGQGVGRRLFDHMLDHFRAIGVNGYFLFTDSSCDVGFYEHNGLKRKASRTLTMGGGAAAGTLECFLYEGNIPENH